MFWIFGALCFFACQEQPKPQSKPVTKKVSVSLDPKHPGDIEIPLEKIETLIPQAKTLSPKEKERLWSVLHLTFSPCEHEESKSILMSLKKNDCEGSHILLQRALRNLTSTDEVLIETTTVSDFWFKKAQQKNTHTTVELWMDEETPALSLIEESLKGLHSASLRICIRKKNIEILNNEPLPLGQKLTEVLHEGLNNAKLDSCSSNIDVAVRASPTWFIEGFRLRGLQSTTSIQRLISLSNQDRSKDGN